MASLMTDNAARDNALRNQAIETAKFPTATFEIREPIDFTDETDLASGFSREVTGLLTIHGVSREETITISGSFNGNTILIFGILGPIMLSDYNIEKPRSAVVLSVEDNASMEFQIFFKKTT
jgi:polyisoprenoid-binding protein YceI